MATRHDVMVEANSWHGTPYVWGGQTHAGADCSGFVKGVFEALGEPLPAGVRTAEQIRQSSERISVAEAKPGDLFFLENTYDNPDQIDQWGPDGRIATHIGFVTEEGSLSHVLDANSGRGTVGLTGWNAWWDDHFLEVRRPSQLDANSVPPDEEAPVDDSAAVAASFVGNLLAPGGELQSALAGIFNSLNEGDAEGAHSQTDALINRVEALWREWTGEE